MRNSKYVVEVASGRGTQDGVGPSGCSSPYELRQRLAGDRGSPLQAFLELWVQSKCLHP